MKKNLIFAMMGAIALTGATGLTACSSSDDVVEELNPTYDPVKKEVTTQFVLNISSAEQGTTRQSAATVQKTKDFRGIKDAKLIGLSTGKGASFLAPFLGSSTGFAVNKTYDLGTLYGSVPEYNTDFDTNNSANKNSNSHRVVELTLPLNTDAMLVYGRAIPDTDDEENGKVVYNVNATPENSTFSLVSRLGESSSEKYTIFTQTSNLAALILNRIMLSEVGEHGMANPITRDKDGEETTLNDRYTQQAALPALTWKELGTKSEEQIAALKPLQENLAKAYKKIQDTYSDAQNIHSGSATAIGNLIKDIYSIANSVANAVATSDEELNAQRLADVIITRIGYYFNTATDPYKFNGLGTGEDGTTISYLVNHGGVSANDFEESGQFGKVTDSYLQGFPTAFNLPDGVAQLTFTAFTGTTGGFSFKAANSNSSLIDIANASPFDVTKYMYPSELLYFDNSLLRVSNNEYEAKDYPDGYNTWDTASSWSEDWSVGKVASSTRSVAVKNNINYGVAMLQTNVALASSVSAFKDNHPTNENVTLSATDIQGFKLTGVLIGGQFKQVGWNYLTTGEGSENKDYIIYDNKIALPSNSTSALIPTTVPNYTLVFDNWFNGSSQSDVKVALEFKNGNNKDIYGIGGMIPKGATFYLVGELKISNATNSSTFEWPTTYAIPPYDDNGASTKTPRIFIQDYVTTATFTIGENSLKSAYTTVPDLRASETSLGLSVDLNWRQGLNFDDVLLGGNE